MALLGCWLWRVHLLRHMAARQRMLGLLQQMFACVAVADVSCLPLTDSRASVSLRWAWACGGYGVFCTWVTSPQLWRQYQGLSVTSGMVPKPLARMLHVAWEPLHVGSPCMWGALAAGLPRAAAGTRGVYSGSAQSLMCAKGGRGAVSALCLAPGPCRLSAAAAALLVCDHHVWLVCGHHVLPALLAPLPLPLPVCCSALHHQRHRQRTSCAAAPAAVAPCAACSAGGQEAL